MIAGGAVMALVYDVDRVTRDVDGLVTKGHGAVLEAANVAAAELGLPRGWLNVGVSVYLSAGPDPTRSVVFDNPHLVVYAASAEHMLALKARAARAQDLGDLRTLTHQLGIDSAAQVADVVNRFFPDDPLDDRASSAIEDLF